MVGTAGGAVGAAPAAVPALTLAATGVLTTAAALKVVDEFLDRLRLVNVQWVRKRALSRGATLEDITKVIADESDRQAAFEGKVRDRMRRDLGRVLGPVGTDGRPTKEQTVALTKLLQRERRYARQRSVAQAVRAFAALDRTVLRRESPNGAFWKLEPSAKSHTPDCVAMAGKFWPWEVLSEFHPPTHAGCLCSLHSYEKAVAAGWMKVGDVQDVRKAISAAAAARALLHEDELEGARAALASAGLVSEEEFDKAIQLMLEGGGS